QHPFEEVILPDDDALDLEQHAPHQFGDRVAVALDVHRFVIHAALVLQGQKGGMPAAVAAFSIGTAKPMPTKTRCSVGFMMAVTMPTTWPSMSTSGPPELPGLAAASNWIRLVSRRWPSGERNSRRSPETTPELTDGPMSNGKPAATTWSPTARSAVERIVAGFRSSGIERARTTARSCFGSSATTTASETWPSANSALIRSAPATTCRLVRIVPLSTMTTPVPTLPSSGSSSSVFALAPKARRRTIDGRIASQAATAGDTGRRVSSE